MLSLSLSAHVKLFGRRPHEGRATGTGAGVRKAAEDETARWGEGWRHTPRYGDLNTAHDLQEAWTAGAT
jgi:hypothetical protein